MQRPFFPASSLFLCIFCMFALMLSSCGESVQKKVSTVTLDYFQTESREQDVPFTVQLQLTPIAEPLLAQTSGEIETLVSVGSVAANKLLVQFKNTTAFKQLKAKKLALKSRLSEIISNLPLPLRTVQEKWKGFNNALSGEKLLPVIPNFQFKEEFTFFENAGIITELNAIVTAEKAMKNNFQLANSKGTIIQLWKKQGDYIRKGEPIADWITGKQVAVRFSDTLFLHLFKTNDTLEIDGNRLVFGIQTAGNTYNAFARKPILNLETQTLIQAKKRISCTAIPKKLMNGNTLFKIQNGKVVRFKPLIIGSNQTANFILTPKQLQLVSPEIGFSVGNKRVKLGKQKTQ